MKLHVLGIDWGKTVCHAVGLDSASRVVIRKKCSPQAAAGLHRERPDTSDRHGSLQWSALSGAGSARARTRSALDADPVRQALCATNQSD